MTENAHDRAIRAYRLARVRAELARRELPAILLFDPVNIRYATGSRNMQVWTMHNPFRYAFVAADGHMVLFETGAAQHLAAGLETVDEVRPSEAWDYMAVGGRGVERARALAGEIAELVRAHGAGSGRLAIDRADLLPARALESVGLALEDGKPVMEHARAVKSVEEVAALERALQACSASVAALRQAVRPGLRECEALAVLAGENIARGGEYMETRLLSSGPRTNPWFQETSDRVMAAGDLLAFDTDLIGPGGFFTDISRTWVVGEGKPTDAQRKPYELARRQLEHNIALLRPGLGFRELSERAWPLPDEYRANRYADIAHGAGLGVEYPLIYYPEDVDSGLYDGTFEAGMVVCVESYIGAEGGHEGVKLEQPVLISDTGPRLLCDYPLEDDWS